MRYVLVGILLGSLVCAAYILPFYLLTRALGDIQIVDTNPE